MTTNELQKKLTSEFEELSKKYPDQQTYEKKLKELIKELIVKIENEIINISYQNLIREPLKIDILKDINIRFADSNFKDLLIDNTLETQAFIKSTFDHSYTNLSNRNFKDISKMSQQFHRVSVQNYTANNNIATFIRAENIGYTHFRYAGYVSQTSSFICSLLADEIIDLTTINLISNSNEFSGNGKMGNGTPLPFISYRGHFNCRHQWRSTSAPITLTYDQLQSKCKLLKAEWIAQGKQVI
jgi:hypothetical protein